MTAPRQETRPSLATPAERAAFGRAARTATPRAGHAAFEPAPDRRDPVELLERQARTRVPELVPIRYGRMIASPFAFFRGAALVMAADLATTPTTGISVQACGDAHLSNFGVFASPERSLLFDVNDFDETLPGPWEWDVKRLAASVVVAARDLEFTATEARQAARAVGEAYRLEMRDLATMTNLDVWYSRVDADELLAELHRQAGASRAKTDRQMAERTSKILAKARRRDSMQALDRLTTVVDGQRRIVSDPPLVVPMEELLPEMEAATMKEWLHGLMTGYRRTLQSDRRRLLDDYHLVQIARKVVGVGSVGTRAWILLLTGRDHNDPLFLQAKEAEASVLETFAGRSHLANHGERVVAGQHLMQAASDIFLGWQRTDGVDGITRDYYVRQLRDWKGSFSLEGAIPQGLTLYARVCGRTLARAHARSGDRVAIAAYLGRSDTFERALATFAESYADQNQQDHQALVTAVREGRVTATTGI